MADSTAASPAMDEFFRRWEGSGAAERANYSMFLNELYDLLEVPRNDPPVLDAYRWRHGDSDDEVLRRLFVLNRRRAEEADGRGQNLSHYRGQIDPPASLPRGATAGRFGEVMSEEQ